MYIRMFYVGRTRGELSLTGFSAPPRGTTSKEHNVFFRFLCKTFSLRLNFTKRLPFTIDLIWLLFRFVLIRFLSYTQYNTELTFSNVGSSFENVPMCIKYFIIIVVSAVSTKRIIEWRLSRIFVLPSQESLNKIVGS